MVKIGGSLGAEMTSACGDVRELVEQGHRVVIVHGGGAEADRLASELGRPARYLTSSKGKGCKRSRYTDAAALDVLTMAVLGRVKPALLATLARAGVRAVGLSGIDVGMITARRNPPARVQIDGAERVVRDDLSGRIGEVDTRLLNLLLDAGYVPVVSPPALEAADPAGAAGTAPGALNVDADRCAAAIAVSLRADWLIVLSNVPGLLRDPGDSASLVTDVHCDDLDSPLAMASGRMKVKVRTAADACLSGVGRVVLADGRLTWPIRSARAGAGTTFVKEGAR